MAGKFEIKKSKQGEFHFNLVAGNGQIILSSDLHKSKASAIRAIESVKKNSKNRDRYFRFVSSSGKPYFVIKASNHHAIAQSCFYETQSSCENGIASVQKNAPDAEIIDLTERA